MSAPEDLNTQIAQRLFGWHPLHGEASWYHGISPGGYAHEPPAYTTDPAATALVWQWVEQVLPVSGVDRYLQRLMIFIARGDLVRCEIDAQWYGEGTTWQGALCRAALALAEALGER